MTYMTNKIVAIQGDHPSKLKSRSDTSIFLANEAQKRIGIELADQIISIYNS